ncbi:MAG: hypothetical protein QM756_45595 [Polyangiaceae bacterium]
MAWSLAFALFGAGALVGVAGFAMAGKSVGHLVVLAIVFGFFGLIFGARMARWARWGAREHIQRRHRLAIEANPARPLAAGASNPVAARSFFGAHRRSKPWAHAVMGLGALVVGLMGVLSMLSGGRDGRAVIVGVGGAFLLLWGVYQRLDWRPYLDISAEGIWCRRWGKNRIGFNEFEAVYPRRSGLNHGVVLVARSPDTLGAKLSWFGRLSLRSGDFGGTSAHVGTLTIWTNRLELPSDELLPALQSLIVAPR